MKDVVSLVFQMTGRPIVILHSSIMTTGQMSFQILVGPWIPELEITE